MFMAAGRSTRAALVGSCLACMLCIGLLTSLSTLDGGGRHSTAPAIAAATLSSSRIRAKDSMDSDPFFSSKRRVPNGPDPIHNRRTGKSGRPPP